MSDITYSANDDGTITKCEDNDGATFLRRGSEERTEIVTLREAVSCASYMRESLVEQLATKGFVVDPKTLEVTKPA